jgi:acetyltransferase-like isoleucine patch superfamily enzyme
MTEGMSSPSLGKEVVVGPFSVIAPGATIGTGTRLGSHVVVEADAVIGVGSTIGSGTIVSGSVRVGPAVTIGANCVLGAGDHDTSAKTRVRIDRGCAIGSAVTVVGGVWIGADAEIRSGSLVVRDVPAGTIVEGSPARIVGYVDHAPEARAGKLGAPTPVAGLAGGCGILALTAVRDLRGDLAALEHDLLPFAPRRSFLVYNVPSIEIRGEHAHRSCHQLLVAVSGSLRVGLDDGLHRDDVHLDSPAVGLHIPPMVWGIQYRFSPDAILLVLASEPYDASEYIRDYDEFRQLLSMTNRAMTIDSDIDHRSIEKRPQAFEKDFDSYE